MKTIVILFLIVSGIKEDIKNYRIPYIENIVKIAGLVEWTLIPVQKGTKTLAIYSVYHTHTNRRNIREENKRASRGDFP